jgi:membrane protein implicated in regulation of membrane protease activity
MSDTTIIKVLKAVMLCGIALILLGVYFHMFNQTIEDMGVTGILISACLVAVGMIMSLPTKMFLTILLVKREQALANNERRAKENKSDAS